MLGRIWRWSLGYWGCDVDKAMMETGCRAAERFIRRLNIKAAEEGRGPVSDDMAEVMRTTFMAGWARAYIYAEARLGGGNALDP